MNVSALPVLNSKKFVDPTGTLRQIHNLFCRSTGLDVFVFLPNRADRAGAHLLKIGDFKQPSFCRLLHTNRQGRKRCMLCHEKMSQRAIEERCPITQVCHAGLVTVHYPVWLTKDQAADLQSVCGLKYAIRANPESVLANVSDLDLPEPEVLRAIHKLKVLSKTRIQSILDWFELIVSYLSELPDESNRDNLAHHHSSRSLAITESADPERQIRNEIQRYVPLPSWRAQRNTGATDLLIDRLILFLSQHSALNLSTKVVAQALGFHPGYLGQVFRQCARESFSDCLRRLRLQKAKNLLRRSCKSVVEIAAQTGFSDPSYFGLLFKKAYGISPKDYRQSAGLWTISELNTHFIIIVT